MINTLTMKLIPWYIIRISGLASLGLLILLMFLGIGHITGFTYRFIEPIKAWALHKLIAIGLGFTVSVHIITLLFDKYIPFSIPQILIPFTSNYYNNTTLFGINFSAIAVTTGIIAMYGIVLIIISSLGLINSKKLLWRNLHYVSYAVMIFAFFHALTTGTDLKNGLLRFIVITIFIVLIIAIMFRVQRSSKTK